MVTTPTIAILRRFLGGMFYVADLVTGEEGKDFKTRTAVPLTSIMAVVAKNHLYTLVGYEVAVSIKV